MHQLGPLARGFAVALVGAATLVAPSSRVEAQAACSAGALSAYLSSAGMGCSVGNLRLRNFATNGISAFADQVQLTPFTLAGPPGYTWVGFTVRFGAQVGSFSPTNLGFSFWSEGAPLYGLMTDIEPAGSSLVRNAVRGRLIGEGGSFRTWDSTPKGDVWACGLLSGSRERCRRGVSQFTDHIVDSDQRYEIEATSIIRGGPANDYTIAVLATNATVAPEPATLLLLSSGVAGV